MNAQIAIEHMVHDLSSAATATFLALFPIVNPLGGVPMFFSLTGGYTTEERRRTALKIAVDVIAFLVVFMLFGRFVLNFFGISLPVLKIAGGLIVANTARGMVAMPMLSGPGSIGVVMGLAAHADHFLAYVGMVVGIVALGLTVYLVLCLGGPFVKRLGPGAVGAINRIFGFLILAIAVQLMWNGAVDFRGPS